MMRMVIEDDVDLRWTAPSGERESYDGMYRKAVPPNHRTKVVLHGYGFSTVMEISGPVRADPQPTDSQRD